PSLSHVPAVASMGACCLVCSFFFQAEDGIRDFHVTGVQTCALPIYCPSIFGRAAGNLRRYAYRCTSYYGRRPRCAEFTRGYTHLSRLHRDMRVPVGPSIMEIRRTAYSENLDRTCPFENRDRHSSRRTNRPIPIHRSWTRLGHRRDLHYRGSCYALSRRHI